MKRLLFACVLLAGCVSNESGLKPDVSYSGYDKAKTVNIAPHGTACQSAACDIVSLGVQWREVEPEQAQLILKTYSFFKNMTGLKIKVDGEEYLAGSAGITDHQVVLGVKESYQGFVVPFSLVEKMSQAESVWLRVSSPTGYSDYVVKDGSVDSKAYHALQRFVAATR